MKTKRVMTAALFAALLGGSTALAQERDTGEEAKAAAKKAARATERGVEKAGKATRDAWITTKVKGKLAAADDVQAVDIHVTTKRKVVTLTGDVGSPAERVRAVQIARDTDGVKDVVDKLEVRVQAN